MRIVIDIPDEDYKLINIADIPNWVRELILNGTPLPDSHGDLIDREVVLDMMNYGILEDNIKTIPSIIPADKGE